MEMQVTEKGFSEISKFFRIFHLIFMGYRVYF